MWNLKRIRNLIFTMLFVFVAAGSVQAEMKSGAQVFELGEVVVTGERRAVNLATTVTEVSEADMVARGAQTVEDALELLPGIDVQTAGKSQAFVSIRGFEQNDVRVLIDGVPAHETYYGLVDLSMLPAEAISKITVTKGASSVLYGANTMGGVINIITKKGGKEPFTEFTTSFGDYSTANYIFNHGASAGKFNYWLTYGYRESDGYRLSGDFDKNSGKVGLGTDSNENGGKRDLSDYIKRTLHAKAGYEPDTDTRVYLSFDYHNNERGVNTEYDRYWRFSKWDQWTLNLVGERKLNDVIKVKARGFYVDHEDCLTDVSWDADHTTSKKWFEESAYDDYSTGGEIQMSFNLGKWSNLKLGVSYIRDNHSQQDLLDSHSYGVTKGWDQPGFTPEEEYEADTYTLAIEDEIKAADRLSLVLGMSYDYFNPKKAYDQPVPDSVDSINPQIGAVYNLTDQTSLHASVGRKTRFPKLLELYSGYAGGNPDLDPQEAIAYEMGASHNFSNAVTGSIALFYNDIDDLIDRIKDPVSGDKIYVNIHEASIVGMEASLDMNFKNGLQASANYTYMSTEDKSNDDRELEGRPRHRINLDLRYLFTFGLSASVQASYTQRQYSDDFNDDDEWSKLPDFFLVNARFAQDLGKVWMMDSEIFIQVTNIGDLDYFETHGPEPGRNFLAGLTIRYR